MQNIPTNALRALAAVYLSGGIRPAGRMLNVAHSSVSRHLSELEALINAPILEKETPGRGITFTSLGERLGREAAESFTKLDQAWEAARERRSANSVVISAAPSVAALWLLPRLPMLSEAHPRIEVSVLADQRVRGPEEEGSDLAIRMGAPQSDGKSQPLMDDALTPVASPRLKSRAQAARGGRASVDQLLQDLPLLHDRDPQGGWSLWTKTFGPNGLDLAHGPRFASSDLLLRAAQQGQGVALARLRLAKDSLASGALVRLSEQSVRLSDAYHLIGRSDRAAGHAVRSVWNWLLDEAIREDLA
ncbi:LysR substrate-binding domain-containing protein [Cognatiyoonia sp. IB215446]|uniref:LysR substrate-binding domain-containing protein n=1 Tax=Cognatiyoonia sp. IB215446 TaxID=3097355 RepID=UPI002A13A047|nr:LysR substrate-binding domain-containing protein [Cognatiyoonia sp. IB215446]MDX8350474.1 LysR substrate-binding domain-containing protein [Cognatiyoonia sp. IB215446]